MPHLLPAAGGLGGDRRLRARVGARARASGSARRPRVTSVRITHIGGPTVLIEVGGLAAAHRPDVRPAGRDVLASAGARARTKLAGPAIAAGRPRPPIDAVLLTHDHHADNLDDAGRALLPSAGVVVTTVSGAGRLGGGARGLAPWATTRARSRRPAGDRGHRDAVPARPAAQPADRRRRRRLRAALGGPGARRALDLGRHRALRRRPRGRRPRARSAPRCCTSAGCGSRSPGPVRYTMTAPRRRRAVRPASARARSIPVHYEGWTHFQEGRDGDRARARRTRRRTSAAASAGSRSAKRSSSRTEGRRVPFPRHVRLGHGRTARPAPPGRAPRLGVARDGPRDRSACPATRCARARSRSASPRSWAAARTRSAPSSSSRSSASSAARPTRRRPRRWSAATSWPTTPRWRRSSWARAGS